MLSYPVRVIPGEEGKVIVVFPDVPEAVSCAESEDDAFARAPGILVQILSGYEAEGRPIPAPSDICGAPMVTIDRPGG